MLFNSLQFFAFLAIVLVLYRGFGQRGQNRMLLVASYVFYGAWDWRFLGLVWLSTLVDFYAARAIQRAVDPSTRKRFLAFSLAVNLGVLGYFKYANFFAANAARVLTGLGLHVSMPVLYIVLPVGISFYTFQTMAYTIDVYRRRLEPVDSLADFALYVCYFPQLVAGPIERAQNLLPQLQAPRRITAASVQSGLTLILIGLFRKVVIADSIGPQVDAIFHQPAAHGAPELWLGAYLFALQIYCDFAGYSSIARGTSQLLGIELMENFQQPYFAANISEFWRRWHISLSTWLRDYLYIPLGGSHHGRLSTLRNLMVTMLLGGLWHGAAWTFVVWGGLHGLYLVGHHSLRRLRGIEGSDMATRGWRRIGGGLLTFHLVLLAWVFFRAPGLRAAVDYLSRMLVEADLAAWIAVLPLIVVPWTLSGLIDLAQFRSARQDFLLGWDRLSQGLATAGMLFLILLAFGRHAPFIYFQF